MNDKIILYLIIIHDGFLNLKEQVKYLVYFSAILKHILINKVIKTDKFKQEKNIQKRVTKIH